jgi:hypothetical protein
MEDSGKLRALEWPMVVLALLVVPALVLDDRATDLRLCEAAHIVNWIVWLGFCAQFAIRFAAEPQRAVCSTRLVRSLPDRHLASLLGARIPSGRAQSPRHPCASELRRLES